MDSVSIFIECNNGNYSQIGDIRIVFLAVVIEIFQVSMIFSLYTSV